MLVNEKIPTMQDNENLKVGKRVRKRGLNFYSQPQGPQCICDNLFKAFRWYDLENIRSSKLPSKPGVYVIRVRERGNEPIKVYNGFVKLLDKLQWKEFKRYVISRLERLRRIGKCPIIYIGAAPSSIKSRYRDLSGVRHTVHYPILALLMGGWKLEYGFKIVNTKGEAKNLERKLKEEYKRVHNKLPALVEK